MLLLRRLKYGLECRQVPSQVACPMPINAPLALQTLQRGEQSPPCQGRSTALVMPPVQLSQHLRRMFWLLQVRLVLDDGQRVLPPYVNRADFDYEAREKGALHAWDSGVLQAPRGQWTRLDARLEGYPPGARRALVILQVWRPSLRSVSNFATTRRLGPATAHAHDVHSELWL